MTPAERSFLERTRVAALATVDGEGRPHVVPICYALLGGAIETDAVEGAAEADDGETAEAAADSPVVRLVSAIDEKPKSTRDLQRVRNIRTEPRVTVLVDRYREDWSRLAWVQVRGRAAIRSPGERGHDEAVRRLRTKYDQYETHDLEDRPIVEVTVRDTRSWGAIEA